MLNYLIKRIALALLTITVIMTVSYVLLRLAPGDPTRSSLIGETGGENLSSDKGVFAQNSAMREKLHLDKPVYMGLFYWFSAIVTKGDFGDSAVVDAGRPVLEIILERLPVTLTLNFWAVLITYLLAIPLGMYAAVYPDGSFDRATTLVLFFLYSLPTVWVALVFQATLSEGGWVSWFPLKGMSSGPYTGMTTWQIICDSVHHYILPVTCLSYAGFASLSRYTRSSMLEVINQDYIRTARAKGVADHVILFKHALRNALITLITLFAGLLPGLIAGSIIIEYVFNINGMGSLSLLSLNSRDYPLQMALFCIGGGLTLAGILLADILYVLVDPRITFKSRA